MSWYHSAAGYPLSFLRIFLRPYPYPPWLELASGLPCPFSAWAALTRQELEAGCSSSPCGDRLGALLWERERYIIYVLSKILENNICYPRWQIFGSKLLRLGYFSFTEAAQNAKLAAVPKNVNSRIREFQKETDRGASSGTPGIALLPPLPQPFPLLAWGVAVSLPAVRLLWPGRTGPGSPELVRRSTANSSSTPAPASAHMAPTNRDFVHLSRSQAEKTEQRRRSARKGPSAPESSASPALHSIQPATWWATPATPPGWELAAFPPRDPPKTLPPPGCPRLHRTQVTIRP